MHETVVDPWAQLRRNIFLSPNLCSHHDNNRACGRNHGFNELSLQLDERDGHWSLGSAKAEDVFVDRHEDLTMTRARLAVTTITALMRSGDTGGAQTADKPGATKK